jgi:mannose-6-phosphate isomerase-like protein (cupin superfamily)
MNPSIPLGRTTAPETYLFLGVTMKILLGSDQTGGQFCMVEGTMPPGEAPPMHIHLREDESMIHLEGELEVTVGDEVFKLLPGQTYFAPRGIPQRLRNTGAVPARSVAVMTPGGFDKLIARLGIPVRNGLPVVAPQAPSPEQMAVVMAAMAEFGIEILPTAD